MTSPGYWVDSKAGTKQRFLYDGGAWLEPGQDYVVGALNLGAQYPHRADGKVFVDTLGTEESTTNGWVVLSTPIVAIADGVAVGTKGEPGLAGALAGASVEQIRQVMASAEPDPRADPGVPVFARYPQGEVSATPAPGEK